MKRLLVLLLLTLGSTYLGSSTKLVATGFYLEILPSGDCGYDMGPCHVIPPAFSTSGAQ